MLEIVLSQDLENFPSDETWRQLLPKWFVEQCVDLATAREEEERLNRLPVEERLRQSKVSRWSVESWVYWFQPDERQWYWWDAKFVNQNTLAVEIQVEGWPFPWGSLEWLLQASGATIVKYDYPEFQDSQTGTARQWLSELKRRLL